MSTAEKLTIILTAAGVAIAAVTLSFTPAFQRFCRNLLNRGNSGMVTLGSLRYEPPAGASSAETPAKPRMADVKTFQSVLDMLSSTGVISFVRDHSFGNAYKADFIDPLYSFNDLTSGPESEFIDLELEFRRKELRSSIQTFLSLLNKNTFWQKDIPGFKRVPDEWERAQGRRYFAAIDAMNEAAQAICDKYDQLVRAAKQKLSE